MEAGVDVETDEHGLLANIEDASKIAPFQDWARDLYVMRQQSFLQQDPLFLYCNDKFLKPTPFSPDIAVAIDDVIEKKFDCFDALESQFYEGGCNATPDLVPSDAAGKAARRKKVRDDLRTTFALGEKFRKALEKRYGKKGAKIEYAEAFEVCEYGRQPTPEELDKLFPV